MKREEPDSSLTRQAVKDAGGAETIDYDTVLKVVQGWTPAMRAALMHNILDTLAQQAEGPRPKRNTLERIAGFLKTDQPAPTDEEVEQWLEERRMEKYG